MDGAACELHLCKVVEAKEVQLLAFWVSALLHPMHGVQGCSYAADAQIPRTQPQITRGTLIAPQRPSF